MGTTQRMRFPAAGRPLEQGDENAMQPLMYTVLCAALVVPWFFTHPGPTARSPEEAVAICAWQPAERQLHARRGGYGYCQE